MKLARMNCGLSKWNEHLTRSIALGMAIVMACTFLFVGALPAKASETVLKVGYADTDPIFVDEEQYGISRDALYEKMKANNVLGRRYFYPLITDFDPYKNIPSANPANLPVANKIANQVICLPMHHALSDEDVKRVVECVTEK